MEHMDSWRRGVVVTLRARLNPEPITLTLVGLGIAGIGFERSKKAKVASDLSCEQPTSALSRFLMSFCGCIQTRQDDSVRGLADMAAVHGVNQLDKNE